MISIFETHDRIGFMSIYTKKGDKGETSLLRKRVSKSSPRIDAIGAIDELNSYLGVVRSFDIEKKTDIFLRKVQEDLFQIGSILAGSNLRFDSRKTSKLEKKIDELEKTLPRLRNFIFPEGEKGATLLFYARTIARRAERKIVALSKSEVVKPSILKYLNRLSDLLFVIARAENKKTNTPEKVWKIK